MQTATPERHFKTTPEQRAAAQRWRKRHPERRKASTRVWLNKLHADPELMERRRANSRRYYANHPEKVMDVGRRYRSRPSPYMADRLRTLLRMAMTKVKRRSKVVKYIGCSLEEFRQHIASQFTPEMTWDNHGSYWVLDHIIPCAKFDLTNPQQQLECFHFLNIRPLEKRANMIKHAKLLP